MPWTKKDVDKHKKGLSDKQKDRWVKVANSALQSCIAEGGSEKTCAASAIRQANGVVGGNEEYAVYKNAQVDYVVSVKTHQKKKHLVVPVTMMVEGVHCGSHGPLLHTITDLGRFPESWNGIPIVIFHPEKDGIPVSANSPDIIDNECVGRVYGTRVEGEKLKANAWLDEEKLGAVSPEALNCINKHLPLEVSVGVFTEDEEEEGEYNGETYEAIAHNHRPDHLALLPGGTGACSFEDGCGIRANEKGGKDVEVVIRDAMRLLNANGFRVSEIEVNEEDGYIVRMDAVRQALYAKDTQSAYHYLEELYDGYLIYAESLQEGGRHLYKQSYTYINDVVEFVGDPVEVKKKVQVDYVTMSVQRTKFNNNNKTKEDSNMDEKCTACVKKKVDALIAHELTNFEERDREFLQGLTEEQLDRMTPKTPPAVNTAKSGKEEESKPAIQALSADDQAALAYGKKLLKEKKDRMIRGIQENTAKDLWPTELLNTMEEEMLEKVFASVQKKAEETPETYDYTVNGGQARLEVNATEEEPLLPAGIELDKK